MILGLSLFDWTLLFVGLIGCMLIAALVTDIVYERNANRNDNI